MRRHWLIDRRTCLKGLGVAMALPLLETMGWAETPKIGGFKAPVRLFPRFGGVALHHRNGVEHLGRNGAGVAIHFDEARHKIIV